MDITRNECTADEELLEFAKEDSSLVDTLLSLNDDNLASRVLETNDVQNSLLNLSWYLQKILEGNLVFCPVAIGSKVWLTDVVERRKVEGTVQRITLENCFGDSFFEVSCCVEERGDFYEYTKQYPFGAVGDTVELQYEDTINTN